MKMPCKDALPCDPHFNIIKSNLLVMYIFGDN